MISEHAELLIELAEKLKNEKRDKSEVVLSLQSSEILDKDGEISENNPTLKEFDKKSKKTL